MIEKVVKRNGRTVNFNSKKIYSAIVKAFSTSEHSTEEARQCAEKLTNEIANMPGVVLSVEAIQDTIEKKLMGSQYKDVAKNFITYRQLRTMARSQYKEL